MRIQHNMAAMNTVAEYQKNNKSITGNFEKLASGYRINKAGDDAAGLAISEKMRRQIKGLEQGVNNVEDGQSLCQVADGALQEVSNILTRMKELSVQSANGTYCDSPERESLQLEVSQLSDEIDRISESTEFNGIKLFKGDTDFEPIVDPTTVIKESLNIEKADPDFYTNGTRTITASDTGLNTNGILTTWDKIKKDPSPGSLADSPIAAGKYVLNDGNIKVSFNMPENADLDDVKNALVGTTFRQDAKLTNAATLNVQSWPNISAGETDPTKRKYYQDFCNSSHAITFDANYVYVDGFGKKSWEELLGSEYADITSKSVAGKTITYENNRDSGDCQNLYSIKFSMTFNSDISASNLMSSSFSLYNSYTSNTKSSSVTLSNNCTSASLTFGGKTVADYFGYTDETEAAADVKLNLTFSGNDMTDTVLNISDVGTGNAADLDLSLKSISVVGDGDWNSSTSTYSNYHPSYYRLSFQSSDGTISASLNLYQTNMISHLNSVKNSNNSYTYSLQSGYDDTIAKTIADIGTSFFGTTSIATYDFNDLQTNSTSYYYNPKAYTFTWSKNDYYVPTIYSDDPCEIWIQDEAEENSGMNITIDRMDTEKIGLEDVSVSTVAQANSATDKIGDAINTVSMIRATIGAQQNRLTHTESNVTAMKTNISAAESQIRDTDMAREITSLSKNNILTQAAQSMLAQANSMPQGVLQLLQ